MRNEATAPQTESFRLDEWEVYPRLNRIQRDGEEIRQVEPKVMRVLVYLAARPGNVVGQQELIDAVWEGMAVSPNVLTYSIAALRKALDDDWRAPRYVETISKSGYRLIAEVNAQAVAVAATADGAVPVAPGDYGDRQPSSAPASRTAAPSRTVPWWGLAAVGLALATAGYALFAAGARAGMAVVEAPATLPILVPLPVTSTPGLEIHPVLSPDGNHVAFAWQPEGQNHYDIYVKLIDSEAPALLVGTPGRDASPAWTPDGLYVVYITIDEAGDCGVYRIPATGGASQRLVDCPGRPIGNMAISPDGTLLAMGATTVGGEPTRILLGSLENGNFAVVDEPMPTDNGDFYPQFSPDGTRLSFHRIRGDGLSDLYVTTLEGGASDGEVRRITHDNRDIGGHDWMADGETILFSSYRTGQFRLWKMPVAGGTPTPAGLGNHQMLSLSLARESGRLAYYSAVTETNMWGAHIAPETALPFDPQTRSWASADWPPAGEPVQIVSSTRWEAHPDLASDNSRVTFASDRSGYFEIWSSGATGADPVQHTRFEGSFVGSPRYAPDDATIVFDARPEGHADLWIVDARRPGPTQLTADPGDEIAPSYSRDGRWIYFTSNRSGDWEIWKIPAAGGDWEWTQVTTTGGYGAQEGPDGYLYYGKAKGPGIWRRPIDLASEEAEVSVLHDWPATDWGSWAIGTRGIYFVARGPNVIALLEWSSGNVVPLHPMGGAPPRQHPALAVSDDETFLIYAQIDRRETDVLMVERIW
ncbi:MAG: hypothetical protein GKS06_00290 [Acidobacteria bacterium]|nr:hypothetical protein [Acidobacteriota bacterium]